MAKHSIEPRMVTVEDALYYLGISASWFQKRKNELVEKFKFPRPHPITKRYDVKQLDRWLDETGGMQSIEISEEQELLERAKSGKY